MQQFGSTPYPPEIGSSQGSNPFRLVLVLAVAACFLVAVHQHLFSVNSEYYYTWRWQWISSATVYPVMLPLAIPFILAQLLYARRPSALWVGLLMVSALGLMLGGAWVQQNPPGFSRISDVVQSRWSTGYFAQAVLLTRKGVTVHQMLGHYASMLNRSFYLHPRQKPPGQVLFEMLMVRLFGSGDSAALISGFAIGAIASFAVLATYLFIAFFTASKDAAFYGASYLALCPGFILLFPMFEQCFAILTVLVAVLWGVALERDQFRYSISLGIACAFAGFITYLPGVIILFLIGYAVIRYITDPQCSLARIIAHATISFFTFSASYLVLWLFTGFNPIATLHECARQVFILWDNLINVYHYPRHSLPGTIFTDLYGFAITSGWVSFLLAAFYFISALKKSLMPQSRVAVLCVMQFLLIAFFGILQTETARIWMFMLPMLMLPVGLELQRWRRTHRFAVYMALLLLTIAMLQSIEFVTPQR